eukprot:GFYU01002792.1.p1 GENE.GFYU01002792.1~~GFYU01002792.1.p1  ORF type:complete len:917 (-),score=406.57 GFYU01002792.1:298-3048(-)
MDSGIFPIKFPKVETRDVSTVENRIKRAVMQRGIRLKDYFRDYDNLRSGFITDRQFFSILDAQARVALTSSEMMHLANKYRTREGDSRINYERFCDTCEEVLGHTDIATKPLKGVPQVPDLLEETLVKLETDIESDLELRRILTLIKSQVVKQMILLKPYFHDFDRNNIGKITIANFLQTLSFLRVNISDQEQKYLVDTYKDPVGGIEIRYLKFHDDLDMLPFGESRPGEDFGSLVPIVKKVERVGLQDPDFESIMERIRVQTVQQRQRPEEFFRDFDRLRKFHCVDTKFMSVLGMMKYNLNPAELRVVADHYRRDTDGKIHYKQFCDDVNIVFTIPNLESSPTKQVPPIHDVVDLAARHQLKQLSDAEEAQIDLILMQCRHFIYESRALIKPVFADHDPHLSGSITRSQFQQSLCLIGLPVTPDQLDLMATKFTGPNNFVNYRAFCDAVDIDNQWPADGDSDRMQPLPKKVVTPEKPDVNIILDRFRVHAYKARIRVIEFFSDFDRLRSGKVQAVTFRRAVAMTGVLLNDAEFAVLAAKYMDDKGEYVYYKAFCDEVDSIFTTKGLETKPLAVPERPEAKLEQIESLFTTTALPERLNDLIFTFGMKAKQRNIYLKPFFHDFDPLSTGRITKFQFRSVLALLELNAREDDLEALTSSLADKGTGLVVYTVFLDAIDAMLQQGTPAYLTQEPLKAITKPKPDDPKVPEQSFEEIIARLQKYVSEFRVRALDFFRDKDRLRKGAVSQPQWRAILDVCRFRLTTGELEKLEAKFVSTKDPNEICYQEFCDLLEGYTTRKGLESDPCGKHNNKLEAKPLTEYTLELSMRDMTTLTACLQRLNITANKKRILMDVYFQDHDINNNGMITKAQFLKTLSFLGLPCTEPEMEVLTKRYGVVAAPSDVNYRKFLADVEESIQF